MGEKDGWQRTDTWLICALMAGTGALLLLTLPGYGLVWDAWELYLGDKNLAFWFSLDPRHLVYQDATVSWYGPSHPDFRVLSQQMQGNPALLWPHEVWPVGATLSSLMKWLFAVKLGWFSIYDAHHLGPVLCALLLLAAVYVFSQRSVERFVGVMACVLLVTHPRLWGHMHCNFKDLPMMALSMASVGLFYWGMHEAKPWCLVGSACAWGVMMSTKGNALVLPFVLGPWFLLEIAMRRKLQRPRPMIAALVAYPIIGLLLMFALWPYLWGDFPAHLQDYAQSIVDRGNKVSREDHRWFYPFLHAVGTCPLAFLGLALCGLGVRVRMAVRKRRWDGLLALLVLWTVVPVGRVMLPGAMDFDAIRHWMEYLLPLSLLAGIGATALVRWLQSCWQQPSRRVLQATLLVVAVLGPVSWTVQHHPHSFCYYSPLLGGLGGAQRRGLPSSTDYWGTSYRTGIDWLNRNAGDKAVVITGVAEHLMLLSDPVWLREDLLPLYLQTLPQERYQQVLSKVPGEIYMMYITRPAWYHPAVRGPDTTLEPVFEVKIDGGVAMKILRLK